MRRPLRSAMRRRASARGPSVRCRACCPRRDSAARAAHPRRARHGRAADVPAAFRERHRPARSRSPRRCGRFSPSRCAACLAVARRGDHARGDRCAWRGPERSCGSARRSFRAARSATRAAASRLRGATIGRREIAARLGGDALAELVAQHARLDLDDLAFAQLAELERAERDADQPVHLQPERLDHVAHLAVLALADRHGEPHIGALLAIERRLDRAVADAVDGDARRAAGRAPPDRPGHGRARDSAAATRSPAVRARARARRRW